MSKEYNELVYEKYLWCNDFDLIETKSSNIMKIRILKPEGMLICVLFSHIAKGTDKI